MQAFTLRETPIQGLLLNLDGGAHIQVPEGSSKQFLLDAALTQLLEEVPEDIKEKLWLAGAREGGSTAQLGLDISRDVIVLHEAIRHRDQQALVRVQTAAGYGGKIQVTANVYDTDISRGEVTRKYKPFPTIGLTPLCTDTYLEQINEGVEFLDFFVILAKGASFRLHRDGRLEGASPQMFVHWNGAALQANVPGRYVGRDAVTLGT